MSDNRCKSVFRRVVAPPAIFDLGKKFFLGVRRIFNGMMIWGRTQKGLRLRKNRKPRYFRRGRYYAFYVDLLGQKDLYSRIPLHGDCKDQVARQSLCVVNHVVNKVYRYTESFVDGFKKHAIEAYKLNRYRGFEKYIKMPESEYVRLVGELQYGTLQFSDSLIFYLRDDGSIAGDVFSFIIPLLSRLAMEYFANGLAIRGVVAYGEGWEVSENHICGDIIKTLTKIEEEITVIPRIVIEDSFVRLCRCELAKNHNLSYANLVGLSMTSFEKDIDGLYELSLWNEPFRKSLLPNEMLVHRDLLIASCKTLYDQFCQYARLASDAEGAIRVGAYSEVARKYAIAFHKLKTKLQLWNVRALNFDEPMKEYSPSPDNYQDTRIDLSEFLVVRLTFSSFAEESDAQEIDISRQMLSVTRVIEYVLSFKCRKSGSSHVWVKVSHIANVIVIAVRVSAEASQVVVALLDVLAKVVVRMLDRCIVINGAIVNANGWLVCDEALCGPVMQKSYEFAKRVGCDGRIVINHDVPLDADLQKYVASDIDGVFIFDYEKLLPEKFKTRWAPRVRAILPRLEQHKRRQGRRYWSYLPAKLYIMERFKIDAV